MGSLPPAPVSYYYTSNASHSRQHHHHVPNKYPSYVTDPFTSHENSTDAFRYSMSLDEMDLSSGNELLEGYFVNGDDVENEHVNGYTEIGATQQYETKLLLSNLQHKQAFYDKSNSHEKLKECIEVLEENFSTIREELMGILRMEDELEKEFGNHRGNESNRDNQQIQSDGLFAKWPESIVEQDVSKVKGELLLEESDEQKNGSNNEQNLIKWSVFGLMGFGRLLDANIRLAPKTFEILTQKMPLQIFTAGFSRMRPGTWIEPHQGYKGYSEYVLRMHLPLIVPESRVMDEDHDHDSNTLSDRENEDSSSCNNRDLFNPTTTLQHPPTDSNTNCFLMCYDEKRRWKRGKCLVFDDSLTHCAWNMTKDTRIILLVDVKYPWKEWLPEGSEFVEPDVHSEDFSKGLQGMLHSIDVGDSEDSRRRDSEARIGSSNPAVPQGDGTDEETRNVFGSRELQR